MKTLSVKQPFAHLICAGLKDIENRTWRTNYRGRVLIHSSAKPLFPASNYLSGLQYAEVVSLAKMHLLDGVRGAIIGSVEIVDCVINHPSIWAEPSNEVYSSKTNKIVEATWNWVLANPILFDKPILNVKGRLGLWDYETKVIRL